MTTIRLFAWYLQFIYDLWYLNLNITRRRLQSEYVVANDSYVMTIFVSSGYLRCVMPFRMFTSSDRLRNYSYFGQTPQSLMDLMNIRKKKPLEFTYNVLLMISLSNTSPIKLTRLSWFFLSNLRNFPRHDNQWFLYADTICYTFRIFC